jgi:hypothetical protein
MMPKLDDLYPSKWLASADLEEDQDLVVTIKNITQEKMRDGTSKVCIAFREPGIKPFLANKTNCKTIAKLYGDESDDWLGKRITLFVTEVDFAGDSVPALRVRSKPPKDPKAAKPAAKATGPIIPKEPGDDDDLGDDDVPY